VNLRLLTYNILKGGQEREAQIVEVIRSVNPDVVVVQEVLDVGPLRQIAAALGMSPYFAQSQGRIPLRVGLLSRLPVLGFRTLRLWPVWPGCLQATVRLANGRSLTVFGLHLAAYLPMVYGVVAYAPGTRLTSVHPANGSGVAPAGR
jgi:endonuclease/exonuclease/phosphatase family metal-dependent hydrolase